MNNDADHPAQHWDHNLEKKDPSPLKQPIFPYINKLFPKLNPKPDITQKAKETFVAVRGSLLIETSDNSTHDERPGVTYSQCIHDLGLMP